MGKRGNGAGQDFHGESKQEVGGGSRKEVGAGRGIELRQGERDLDRKQGERDGVNGGPWVPPQGWRGAPMGGEEALPVAGIPQQGGQGLETQKDPLAL